MDGSLFSYCLGFPALASIISEALHAGPVEVAHISFTPAIWDFFQLVQPEDVDRILCSVRPTAYSFDHCLAWLGLWGLVKWTKSNQFISGRESATSSIKAVGSVPLPDETVARLHHVR